MALWTKASLCGKSSLSEQSLPRLVRHPFGGTPSRPKTSVNPVKLSNFSSFLCAFCAFLWLKNPRNLRLKNSCLCVFVAINPFNQRNPWLINYLRACKALYKCRETFTDVMSALQIGPFCSNKANFRKSQMNVTDLLTKDYDQMDTWLSGKNKPNSNPIQTQFKPNQSQYKPNSNPNKPNFTLTYLWRLKSMADYSTMPPVKRIREVSNRGRQIDDILGVKSMKRCSLLIVRDYSDGSFRRD